VIGGGRAGDSTEASCWPSQIDFTFRGSTREAKEALHMSERKAFLLEGKAVRESRMEMEIRGTQGSSQCGEGRGSAKRDTGNIISTNRADMEGCRFSGAVPTMKKKDAT